MAQIGRYRTEITIETQSVTTIRTRSGSHRLAYCEICGGGVTPVVVSLVADALGQNADQIENLCTSGSIHRLADSEICGSSLAMFLGRERCGREMRESDTRQTSEGLANAVMSERLRSVEKRITEKP